MKKNVIDKILPKGNQCVLQRSCIATATGDNGRGCIEKVFAN